MKLRSAVFGATTQTRPNPSGAWTGLILIFTLSVLLLSSACTPTTRKRSTPMPWFDTVAIESMGATSALKARFGVAPGDEIFEESMGAGTGAGMVAGAGWALVCGPFFFLCATFTIPAGAVVGGAAGGLVGAASDAHKMPPDEQLLALDKLFADIYQQRTLHMEIRDSLEKQIPPDRLVDTSKAGELVQLKLADVRFTRTFSGKYEWELKSVMVVSWNRHPGRTRHSSKTYDYASQALSLDDWMKNDGEMLSQGLDESVEGLTKQMAVDMQFIKR
jgi:hypothetical protein